MSKTIQTLLFWGLILCSFHAYSTHIAGYDMNVQWISGNSYSVNLKMFRDCANAGANFDNSAQFNLYDNNSNALVSNFTMNLDSVVSVSLGDSCFPAPPGMCFQEGFYSATITLPNNANGYYMAWERCCRSPIISNLQSPNTRGIVLYAQVPPASFNNTTPSFGRYPSNGYLCVNQTNTIDFEVTEPDGDSLVYSLITPMIGTFSSPSNPFPNGSNPKPYALANWATGYSLSNIVGGNSAMAIDPQTGVITCSPSTSGVFTFAVKIEEFRNGVKLSEVIRDIYYYATTCNSPQQVTLDQSDTHFTFLNDTTLCLGFEVSATLTDSIIIEVNSTDIDLNASLDPPTVVGSGFFYPQQGSMDSITMPVWQQINPNTFVGGNDIQLRYCWSVPCTVLDSTYNFEIEVINNGWCSSDTFQFSPSVDADRIVQTLGLNDTILCSEDSLEIILDAHYRILWNNGSDSTHTFFDTPGVYDVYMEDTITGCSIVDTFAIQHFPELTLQIPNDTILCEGDSKTLWFSSSGGNGNPLTINWWDNDNWTSNDEAPIVTPEDSTAYFISIDDGCTLVSDTAIVDVEILPELAINIDTSNGCIPLLVQFDLIQPGSSILDNVFWDFNNGTTANQYDSVVVEFNSEGIYDVYLQVTSTIGCVKDTTFLNLIEAYGIPIAEFSTTPENALISNPSIQFNNQSIEATSYLWNFDTIASSTEVNPVVEFPEDSPRSYEVCLIATNEYTCADTICKEIAIHGEMSVFVPNSFTPNNDGINDVFIPIIDHYEEGSYSFFIMDRWGHVIFSSESDQSGWDGTINGQPAAIGVYAYQIELKDKWSIKSKRITGHVNLIR